eukprot:m.138684 g.138684  ORF g.138684 m.138684 type:complete len:377 (+) comp16257_c0_seq1:34-1164(+)
MHSLPVPPTRVVPSRTTSSAPSSRRRTIQLVVLCLIVSFVGASLTYNFLHGQDIVNCMNTRNPAMAGGSVGETTIIFKTIAPSSPSSASSLSSTEGPTTHFVHEIELNSHDPHAAKDGDELENFPTVLIATPIRQKENSIQRYFTLVEKLDYPKDRISWALLVGDSTDTTEEKIIKEFRALKGYRKLMVVKKDFNFQVNERMRHAMNIQQTRRSYLAQIRNSLIVSALTDEDWVLWIDSDVFSFESNMLKRLLELKKDIVAPHIVMPSGQTYDLNSWQETDKSRDMQKRLKENEVLIEGYPGKNTYRKHMDEIKGVQELDGVGGAVLLVNGEAHRRGLMFPMFPFKHQLETEGLGKMAREMGFIPFGTTEVKVIHK